MKTFALLGLILSLAAGAGYADMGMKFTDQSTADGVFRVTGKVAEPTIFAKKASNFEFDVTRGNEKITDAAVTLTCYLIVDGFVCPTDTDVQSEKPGKCSKCQSDFTNGRIRKATKPGIRLPFAKYGYNGKLVLDKVGEHVAELKVEPVDAPAFTVAFPFNAETWVEPKKHTCQSCGGTYPGPGHCKKCGMALIEKGTEAETNKKDPHKHGKKH